MANDLNEDKRVTYFGDWKVRTFTMDITNYDDGSNGNGEPFTPSDAGMHRFRHVLVDSIGAGTATNNFEGSVAIYDEDVEGVRLYVTGGSADAELNELPAAGNNGALVRITAIGK